MMPSPSHVSMLGPRLGALEPRKLTAGTSRNYQRKITQLEVATK